MFRSLIGLDFNKAIRQIQCPALVLFAERDFKVEPTRSSKLAEAALAATGRVDWTVRVIKGADHLPTGASGSRGRQRIAARFRIPKHHDDVAG